MFSSRNLSLITSDKWWCELWLIDTFTCLHPNTAAWEEPRVEAWSRTRRCCTNKSPAVLSGHFRHLSLFSLFGVFFSIGSMCLGNCKWQRWLHFYRALSPPSALEAHLVFLLLWFGKCSVDIWVDVVLAGDGLGCSASQEDQASLPASHHSSSGRPQLRPGVHWAAARPQSPCWWCRPQRPAAGGLCRLWLLITVFDLMVDHVLL